MILRLGELIDIFKELPPHIVFEEGFDSPHSYRGYYSELGLEPASNVTVKNMLFDLRYANGTVFGGWKGGDYRMNDDTELYLAYEGNTGEELTMWWLKYQLLKAGVKWKANA